MLLEQVLKTSHFDLHMHTTASDGVYSPKQLVQKAYDTGLKTIAITDHDTLSGVLEAQEAGASLGVQVIAGVELSTKYKGKSIDILGYNVTESSELAALLVKMQQARENRAQLIIEKFCQINMPLTLKDVLVFSQGGVIARPHIARAVVAKGYVEDYQTVFDEYLADGKPCALDKMILSPEEGIGLIHRAGGKAVLAHPALIEDDSLVLELLEKFPFDGIEVWHRKQNKEHTKRYRKFATEYNLLMTGGSDFHTDEHQLGSFGLEW